MYSCNKQLLNRLKRAEGQIRGIHKMIEEQKDCSDVITQLSAVRSSVDRIMGVIVAENLMHCMEHPTSDYDEQLKRMEQAIQLIIKK
ncbi:metal-sensitive transcriptional regulator [Atopobacter phocae]|uniref:metal-sensitive transcriptional regulator n=1 Tax=Atopobacter phocae TaxID=136492 RepID=UPI00046F9D4D|nr:metal-sensitive transcriptional regulator [Atopobacter phocae]